jgi:hypothetical protein
LIAGLLVTVGMNTAAAGWDTDLFARPQVGGSTFTAADTTRESFAAVAAAGGLRYWQTREKSPKLIGQTRLQAQYLMSGGAGEGMLVKIGSFMGPTWNHIGLSVGPDLLWSRYVYGDVDLLPSFGLALPLTLTLGINRFGVYGGAEAAYLLNEERRVDWDQTRDLGIGHEFSILGGANLSFEQIVAGFSYRRTVTVSGIQLGYGFSLTFRA